MVFAMKYKVLLLIVAFTTFLSNAQSVQLIASAEISFVFLNNDVEGTLSGFNSSSTIDLNNLENSQLKGSVDIATISTGNSIRNWSLKRGKYFDADTYPKITFESNTIQVYGRNITVKGQLTIKDITKELSFKFIRNENQLLGTATLYSSDFGIHIKNDREKNKVNAKIILNLK